MLVVCSATIFHHFSDIATPNKPDSDVMLVQQSKKNVKHDVDVSRLEIVATEVGEGERYKVAEPER